MSSDAKQPIIIVRKVVKGHGGHHGGAWKVAYADFVTAMMSLFIVLWLMNANDETKRAIAGYFIDPTGKTGEIGSGAAGTGDGLVVQQGDLSKLKEKIETIMKEMPDMNGQLQKQVAMTVTGEGLRIEMLENETGMFFEQGNAQPSDKGKGLLAALATELKKLDNNVMVEGHTDAKPFAHAGGYSNWELSTDRANSARRALELAGMPPGRIKQVRGFADQRLRLAGDPQNASNRRVSIVVEYKNAPAAASAPAKAATHTTASAAKH